VEPDPKKGYSSSLDKPSSKTLLSSKPASAGWVLRHPFLASTLECNFYTCYPAHTMRGFVWKYWKLGWAARDYDAIIGYEQIIGRLWYRVTPKLSQPTPL